MTDRPMNNGGKPCPLCKRTEWHAQGSLKCEATELALARERLAALSRIIRRTLACGQLEKLEDARPYLGEEPAPFDPKRCAVHTWFRPEPGQPCCFCVDAAAAHQPTPQRAGETERER